MKILTWNINGIRASKRCLKDVLDSLDADVICLQETKITRDMLDEPSAIVEGYNAYFSFSRKRSGYSGTANFCRDGATPTGAEEGLSGQLNSQAEGSIGCLGSMGEFDVEELRSLDGEGRAILTQHQIQAENEEAKDLVIINVYVPRATERDDRWTYKLHFLALLQSRAESLLRQGRHVIVLGDINTTHKRIDHCDPSSQEYLRTDSREWVDQFLRPEDRDPELGHVEDKASFEATLSDAEGGHFIDAFRYFYPEQTEAYTNWSTVTAARQTNYGKRLDYIFVDRGLEPLLEDCRIVADYDGSDHCPVVVQLGCRAVPSSKCPPLCTKFMPEFQGRQQKLLQFFATCVAPQAHVCAEDTVSPSPSPPSQPEKDIDQKSSQKTLLKRPSKDVKADSPVKKKKRGKGDKNSAVVSGQVTRQGSLLNFFQRASAPAASATRTASSAPTTLEAGDGAQPTPAHHQHSSNHTRSQYWQQGAEGARQPALTTSDSGASGVPRPSPTKLSLPSLTLIAEGKAPALHPSSDTPSPGPSSSQSSEGETGNVPLEEHPPVCRMPSEETQAKAKGAWKSLLSGPPPPPLCKGHAEPCVLRTVKKAGPTKGRQFYVCARPEGHSSNKDARCDHFQWVNYMSAGKKKP